MKVPSPTCTGAYMSAKWPCSTCSRSAVGTSSTEAKPETYGGDPLEITTMENRPASPAVGDRAPDGVAGAVEAAAVLRRGGGQLALRDADAVGDLGLRGLPLAVQDRRR